MFIDDDVIVMSFKHTNIMHFYNVMYISTLLIIMISHAYPL